MILESMDVDATQFEAQGFTVVSVALDLDPERAREWIDAAPASEGGTQRVALVDRRKPTPQDGGQH